MAHTTSTVMACAAALVAAGAASAAVDPLALGSDMVGGTVTVSWYSGPGGVFLGTTSGVIGSPSAGVGVAEIADPFGTTPTGAVLTVSGDTFLATWELDNNADAIIGEVIIDLSGSFSVFDDNSTPSTPGSELGTAGVFYDPASTAPQEILAQEFDPVAIGNAGDLFHQQRIQWNIAAGAPVFGFSQTYRWLDDTDLIPAPGVATLGVIAGLGAARRRRR